MNDMNMSTYYKFYNLSLQIAKKLSSMFPSRFELTIYDNIFTLIDKKDDSVYQASSFDIEDVERNYPYCSESIITTWGIENVNTFNKLDLIYSEMDKSIKWKTRFLGLAKHIAKDSKDPSTKVGAVIVDEDNNVRTIGYNGFPRGVKDTQERLNDRKLKYPLTVHAELNALLTMARVGTPTKGTTMVCTHYPCSNCSGAMVQAGIKEVVVYSPNEDFKSRWSEDMEMSKLILKEGGVEVVVIDDIVEVDDEI